MLKALIDLFKTKQEEKQPEAPAQVVKEPAPTPSQWSPVPDTAPNIVVDVPTNIKIPTVEAAFIAEPVAVKDEIKVEVEKKPRGRPKSGKPKTKKK